MVRGKLDLDQYKNRMTKIRMLSSPQFDGHVTAEMYSEVLVKNFSEIGNLAKENRKFLEENLTPYLEDERVLTDEEINLLNNLNEGLIDAEEGNSIDAPISALILDRLAKDAEKKEDEEYLIQQLDKKIEVCYLLVNMLSRPGTEDELSLYPASEGEKAYEKLMSYLDHDKFKNLSDESKEIVIVNSRYAANIYEVLGEQTDLYQKKKLEKLAFAEEIMKDDFYREQLPDYDWDYHAFRLYEYGTKTEPSRIKEQKYLEEIYRYSDLLLKMFESDPKKYGEYSSEHAVRCRHLDGLYYSGRIGLEEYLLKLYEFFKQRNPSDYEEDGITDNVEVCECYISALQGQIEKYGTKYVIPEEKILVVEDMVLSAIDYFYRVPKLGTLSSMLGLASVIINSFIEVPGVMTFMDCGLRFMAALHPPTYVHSCMVANISRCLARHVVDLYPEKLIGFLGMKSVIEVKEKKLKILEFAYNAALCHDFGKLVVIDTIFVYGRNLLDFEFEIIKKHPEEGALLLRKFESTKAYANIAEGHHKYYDNSKGYPPKFDTSKCEEKPIIDIISLADSMDAATDSIGRSYNTGKTFDEFLREVDDGAGTRYASYFPQLLRNKEVRRDLYYVLSEGRKDKYRETFHILRSMQKD